MPGGLVDVDVDRHHEVEPGQRLVEPVPVGRGRAPGCRRCVSSARTWPSPGVRDLLGAAPTPAARRRTPAGRAPGCATRSKSPGPSSPRPTRSTAGRGEHRAARPVEVAGEDVERLDRPLADHAEGLGGDAHPPVHGRRSARGEVAREAAHGIRGMPLTCSASSGVNGCDRLAHRVDARRRTPAGVASALGEQLAHHRQQHAASDPGRTKWCSSATLAVSVRRGSMTTSRPPRRLSSRRRLGKSGTVISEPFDAIGLCADEQEAGRCGRCRGPAGGTGGRRAPRPRQLVRAAGRPRWRENRLRVRSSRTSVGLWVSAPRLCTLGLPW